MLSAISCRKEPLRNTQTAIAQTQENAAAQIAGHFIGERFGGGIVFYIDGTGKHGLISDTVNLQAAVWWNGTYIKTGATATAIGSGKTNTKLIVAAQGKPINPGYNYAAWQCSKSKNSGYTDWYLPSKDELNELYNLRNVVGGIPYDGFWSSSESDDVVAWYLGFNNGSLNYIYKTIGFDVRAVRSF